MEHLEQPTQQNPEMVIMGIREQAMRQGRNDSEWTSFNDILTKYQNKELSGPEAIAAAQHILDTKQDYN